MVHSAIKGRQSRDTNAVNASQLLDRSDFTRYKDVQREVSSTSIQFAEDSSSSIVFTVYACMACMVHASTQ
jgi:hypothetical protein